ncbi:MAG: serine/threonine-protein phosphatase [Alphaproteobacteria bacterium]|nr:serine/threonine-protein phosphatase [Alphaproteobacteria bacterium]
MDDFLTHVEAAGLTDVGRRRSLNEDCWRMEPELGLFLVADGLGGHQAGEVASRLALETIVDALRRRDLDDLLGGDDGGRSEAVKAAVAEANGRIRHENDRLGHGEDSMGTTVVGLLLETPEQAVIFHVGDSRIYRLRDGRLEQMTRDHSLHQQWLDGGGGGAEPKKNVILRALGPFPEAEAEVAAVPTRPGDVWLLCSDGLTGMVEDDEIAKIIATHPNLESACQALIDAANDAGGKDNITAVLVRR